MVSESFKKRLYSNPEVWKPENPGDALYGKLISFEWREGNFGSYPLFSIEDEDGSEYEFHGFGAQLLGEAKRRNFTPGDIVGFRFVEEVTPASGLNPYKKFRIVHEKQDGTPALKAVEGEPTNEEWAAMQDDENLAI